MASQTKRRLESESEPVAQEAKTKKSLKPTRNIFLEAWEELKQEEIKKAEEAEAGWVAVQELVDLLTFERLRAAKKALASSCTDAVQKLGYAASELVDKLEKRKERGNKPLQPNTKFNQFEIEQRALVIFQRAYPELDDLARSTLLRRVQDPDWRQIIETLPQQREELVKLLKQ